MKVTNIAEVLDLAVQAKSQGRKFVPCFTGDAGIGKSEICQQWAKDRGYSFLDLRLAYLENPDMVGLPFLQDGRTVFATPEMWPSSGKWLILLDEMNRANPSVLNTIMQLLTDFKINKYELPKDAIIAAVINPDNSNYDVATLDTALKDRIAEIPVFYDKNTFVEFMNNNDFDSRIISYVQSGTWVFRKPEEIGDKGKYIAPRTWARLNAGMKAGLTPENNLFLTVCMSILGETEAHQFNAFCTETKPVTYGDFIENRKKALKTLAKYSDRQNYRGDLLDVSMTSFISNIKELSKKDVFDIVENLTSDLTFKLCMEKYTQLAKEALQNGKKEIDPKNDFFKGYEEIFEKVKEGMKKANEQLSN